MRLLRAFSSLDLEMATTSQSWAAPKLPPTVFFMALHVLGLLAALFLQV